MIMDAILLAAGNSVRFGENKLLYRMGGRAMYDYVLEILIALKRTGRLEHVVVVTQYEQIKEEIERKKEGIAVVRNHAPELGISHSVFLGVERLKRLAPESDACLFTVGDQPFLTEASVRQFLADWQQSGKGLGACAAGAVTGNPCIFSRSYYGALQELTGDKGGKRIILANREDTFLFEVPARELEDIDVKNISE